MTSETARRHRHYRLYFQFKDGREKYGLWHHSKRKAWDEVRAIIHNPAVEWANAECLAENGYGVEAYFVAGGKLDCRG